MTKNKWKLNISDTKFYIYKLSGGQTSTIRHKLFRKLSRAKVNGQYSELLQSAKQKVMKVCDVNSKQISPPAELLLR